MRLRSWLGPSGFAAMIAVLVGCGGAGGSDAGGSGGSGGSGGTGGGVQNQEAGTARVDVNAQTGVVTVTPLNQPPGQNQSNSLYTGSAVGITSSSLGFDEGELTVRKLKLSIANNTGESLGQDGGAKLIVDKISTDAGGSLDLRQFSNVSTIVGPGSSASDGPGPSVTISQPTGIARDTDGTLFLVGSGDGSLRRLKDGSVTRIATGLATPGGVTLNSGFAFIVEQSAHNLVRVGASGGAKFVLAGSGSAGFADGTGAAAQFNSPRDIEMIGSTAFIADNLNDKIRKATNLTGASAVVTTLPVFPVIIRPSGLTSMTLAGIDWLVVASTQTHKIFLVNSVSGQSFLIAGTGVLGSNDGSGSVATFDNPFDVTVSGGAIFVADLGNRVIRQIMLNEGAQPQFASSWTVKTLAGDGVSGAVDGLGATARFASPRFMETDGSGALIVSDLTNNRTRRVTAAGGVFPVTGGGGTNAGSVSVINPDGYVPDPGNYTSRKATYHLDPIAQNATSDVDLTFAVAPEVKSFYFIVSVSAESSTYAALDAVDGTVLKKGTPSVNVRTLSGTGTFGWVDGAPTVAQYNGQADVSSSGAAVYIADRENNSIRRLAADGTVYTIAGLPGITGIANNGGTGATCSFSDPTGIHASSNDLELFVVDDVAQAVYYLARTSGSDPNDPFSWQVSVIAGTVGTSGYQLGPGTITRFNYPFGIVADESGRTLFVAEYFGQCVKKVTFTGGNKSNSGDWTSSLVAGSTAALSGYQDGQGSSARFYAPYRVALSRTGELFVAEFFGNRIRRISMSGNVSLLVGSSVGAGGYVDADGGNALMNAPCGMAVDNGNYLYVCDVNNSVIRRIDLTTRVMRTVAGRQAFSGALDGLGDNCSIDANGMCYDPKRGLIIAGGFGGIRLVERVVRVGKP